MTTTHESTTPGMPPVVYVPTTTGPVPELRQVVMHRLADGRTALFTYSAPDRLNDYYRAGQPWVLLDIESLQRVHDQTPYDVLFVDIDPDIPAEDDDNGEPA